MQAGELYLSLNGFWNRMANENRTDPYEFVWSCWVVRWDLRWVEKKHPKQIFFHQYKFQICNLLWLGDLFSPIFIYIIFWGKNFPQK
jgi:hypothetical protein